MSNVEAEGSPVVYHAVAPPDIPALTHGMGSATTPWRERIFDADPLLTARLGQVLIGDKNYYGREFEATRDQAGVRLLRPTAKACRTAPVRTC